MTDSAEKQRLWWGTRFYIAFFGIVLLANGVFVWFALDSWTGETVGNAYERGLNYDDVLSQAIRQDQLKWSVRIHVESDNSDRRLIVTFRDADNMPLTELEVTGQMVRPISEDQDRPIQLQENHPGQYELKLEDLPHGQWDIRILGTDGQNSYRLTERVFL